MNGFRGFLSLLWRGWFVLVSILSTLIFGVFLILPFSFRDEDYPKAYYFLRYWAITIFYASGLSIKKHDFNDISVHHPYIIISNHTSMMDIMVMLMINKNPIVFIGKKELEKLPIFGFIYKRLMITVDRSDANSRQKVYRHSIQALQKGNAICIFPEGGVPDESILLDDFRNGAFAIALKQRVPLITTTIFGLKEILPYAYFRGAPGTVHIFLNEIAQVNQYKELEVDELKERSYNLIYRKLKEMYTLNN